MQFETQNGLPRSDRPLPRRQLIAQVKAGSTAHIWELYDSFKPEDCTVDLLKGTLNHLRPELIPDIDPEDRLAAETHPRANAAAASLLLLSKLAAAFRNAPAHTELAGDLILSAMDGVLQWVNFCLDFGVPRSGQTEEKVAYTLLSEVLFVLGLMNGKRMSQAFLSSRAFLRTFFRIWTAKDELKGRQAVYWDFRPWRLDHDPIVGIAWLLLGSDPSNTILIIGKELSTLDLALPFASAAIQRASQVRNAVADPGFPAGLVEYAKRIMQLVIHFIRVPDRNLDALRSCFTQVHAIDRLTAMLDKLTSALIARQIVQAGQNPERPILSLIEPLAQLLGLVLVTEPRTVHSVCVFLKGGGMTLLARMIVAVDGHDNKSATGIAGSLTKMIPLTAWPRVLKQLLGLGRRPLDPSMKKITGISQIMPVWEAFWSTASKRMRVYQTFGEGDRFMICDNFLCPRDERFIRQGSPKQCSRCSSVLYCSQSCQRRDWDHQHRDECAHGRQLYLKRQAAGMGYDHKSRAFHVRVVETLCEERYMPLFQRRVGRWGLSLHDFHPIFECNVEEVNEEIVLFRTHPTPDLWMHKPDAPLTEKYLWPRMNSLGEVYTQRMKNSEMRLAEAVFSHGPKTDVYVYVLLKQVGQRFQAIYSIPRIAVTNKQP